MAEVLSQGEIDALLSALNSGEVSAEEMRREDQEKKVRLYDFKRAMRFSKDQIRTMIRIFEGYARLLTSYFSAQLRTFVQISVVSVDQVPYEEFILSVPKLTFLNVFEARPLDGQLVMEINANVGFAMLDRVLGGLGTSEGNVRPLTEIEMTVLERLFSRALELFGEAWQGITELDPVLSLIEINPQFLQIVSANETTAVAAMTMKIGETTGTINVCMPHVVLEPVMPRLSAHYWPVGKILTDDPEQSAAIRNSLAKAPVPVVAELGNSEISVKELLELTEGDVITLDCDVGEPLLVRVAGEPKFRVQPGTSRGKMAVQVVEVLTEEVDEDE